MHSAIRFGQDLGCIYRWGSDFKLSAMGVSVVQDMERELAVFYQKC